MKDETIKALIQTLDTKTEPPEGLRERVLARTLALKTPRIPALTPLEQFFFQKPLAAAASVAAVVSGALWAVMGGGFSTILVQMIR
jgi:hypothetical protein